jgi:hypothetical protein
MKLRITLVTLLVVGVLVTSVCRKNETSGLEELPKDIAAQLQRVPNSDLLVAVPPVPAKTPAAKNRTPNAPAAAPGVKALAPPCQSTTTFLIQVTYPVTVCSNVRDFFDVLTAYDAVMSPGSKSPTDVKNYKLSTFQGKALTSVFCRVRSGPWLATIVKKLDCQTRGSCQMTIGGIPSSPLFLWNGQSCESQNRPTEVNYIEPLVEAGSSRTPCNTKNTCQ